MNMVTKDEIDNESDNETSEAQLGYFTRSKRRKLENGRENYKKASKNSILKRKIPILFLPNEVLTIILSYLSGNELSENIRLVNKRFQELSGNILNNSFKKIGKTIKTLISSTELSLRCINDDIELKCVLKLLNMLEILNSSYAIVIATVWSFIYKFLKNPDLLYGVAMIDDYNLPSELTKILEMTKKFCVHFDKVIEEPITNFPPQSGCKLIDIFNCAICSRRNIISEKVVGKDSFTGEYCYVFQNSWFVVIPINSSKQSEWFHRRRMMHMRIRRIVLAHNELLLQHNQYERDHILRPDPTLNRTRTPPNSIYTGYGDMGNNFFYYGVMNDGAYMQKFSDELGEEQEQPNGLDQNEVHAVLDQENVDDENNSESNLLYRLPYLGFHVYIKVKCPLSFAPLNFLSTLDGSLVQRLKHNKITEGSVDMKVSFDCMAATYPCLPTHYEYHQTN
ncbi:uncharacterized protein [Diabrotica undecimpunctata]|uniref:uncharacterized protein n=1 Tax=Diabrotica undecimpunctata TaxID=50387 RepID=UPI003B63E617